MDKQAKVLEFLKSWTDGVISIGKTYQRDGDFQEGAEFFLNTHYAFGENEVLFKPTFTKDVIFRNSFNQALSYFVSGSISEDRGFAIRPWKKIELHDQPNLIIEGDVVVVMGALDFYHFESEVSSIVSFTFVLKEFEGRFKIIVHHSSPVMDINF
ncbi:MAG: hypothetical protein CML81_06080 [Rhodobiaceae bacterium]|nr:hypothetical protein [Rhodobiaceae bacterium]RPF96409.1 MAG: hypothetical protein CBD87_006055 [Rhizobiales bacterium TMED227]|tara:strand:- start:3462 stop:3926 length:465 start_codon:yes stop_codon:yes gene_type:complete